MRVYISRLLIMTLVLVLSLGTVAGCTTQGPDTKGAAEFYKGKTITWICTPAGDAIDANARLIAPYLSEAIGATVKVENMESDIGPNYVWSQEPDGLWLSSNAVTSFISKDILKSPGTIFEADQFNWIANMNPYFWIVSTSPKSNLTTFDELMAAKGVKWASSVARGSLHGAAAAIIEVLGLDAQVILGYKGGSGSMAAVGTGECDVFAIADSTTLKGEQGGLLRPIFTVSDQRSAVYPDLPN